MRHASGQLSTLRHRLCPTWAALGAVVLLAFLALGSVHDHGDHDPGTTAIHCPVAAGPVVESTGADQLHLEVASAVALVWPAPRRAPSSRPSLRSDRARAPPAPAA